MTNYHLVAKSENAKTGPIPVSMTSADTCPDSCAHKDNTCYARFSYLGIQWSRLSKGTHSHSLTFAEFLTKIKALPDGQLWRHNQAGDLPGVNETLDISALNALVAANTGKRGFTYTHKPLHTAGEQLAVKLANDAGFTVNLSADSPVQADELKALGIGPVATVCNTNVTQNFRTPAGHLVVICPATQRDNVTCASCKLCAWADRDVIIGFPAHGTKRKQVLPNQLIQIGE